MKGEQGLPRILEDVAAKPQPFNISTRSTG